MLARGLLPTENDPPELSPRVKALLSSDDDNEMDASSGRPKLTLRQVRLSNIDAMRHDHAWHENSHVQAYKFSVGDFGYIPEGKDFNEFVIFGNVFKDELTNFPVESLASGQQWCWKDFPIQRADITPYSLPGDVKWWASKIVPSSFIAEDCTPHSWPLAVPHGAQMDCQIMQSNVVANVSDAWRFFIGNCQSLAEEFNVKPENLMLSGLHLLHSRLDLTFRTSNPSWDRPTLLYSRLQVWIPAYWLPTSDAQALHAHPAKVQLSSECECSQSLSRPFRAAELYPDDHVPNDLDGSRLRPVLDT